MKPLTRLESLIADIVERPAWLLSARRLHPLDLTTALTKGMEDRAVRLADRVLAPDSYNLRLNPVDASTFADALPVLERELGAYLGRTVAERDLSCHRPPTVKIAVDEGVKPGKIEVTAAFSGTSHEPAPALGTRRLPRNEAVRQRQPYHDGTPARSPAAPAPALQLLGEDGRVVRAFSFNDKSVTRGQMVIGRRAGADISLPDGKVSREHARLSQHAGGYVLTDLQSLNGTYVNGMPVQGQRLLNDGDILEIGHFRLKFVAVLHG